MIQPMPFQERLRCVFTSPREVVGLVDDLLGLCHEQGLRIDYLNAHCVVRSIGDQAQETEIPLPKSVFRAILARVAALCNDQHPDAVTPYGGEAQFSLGSIPSAIFHVAFTNTPEEQRLQVMCR